MPGPAFSGARVRRVVFPIPLLPAGDLAYGVPLTPLAAARVVRKVRLDRSSFRGSRPGFDSLARYPSRLRARSGSTPPGSRCRPFAPAFTRAARRRGAPGTQPVGHVCRWHWCRRHLWSRQGLQGARPAPWNDRASPTRGITLAARHRAPAQALMSRRRNSGNAQIPPRRHCHRS